MKPNSKLAAVAAAVLGALVTSCVPNSSLEILGMFEELDSACVFKVDTGAIQLTRSDVDVGYGPTLDPTNVSFLAVLRVQSQLDATTITEVGGQNLPSTRNDYLLSSYELSYACADTSSASKCTGFHSVNYTVPTSGLLKAGGQFDFVMDLLNPTVVTALQAKASSTPITILVGIKLHGELYSGQSLDTDFFYFPLDVYNTTPQTCAAGFTLQATAAATSLPCGNCAQDPGACQCMCGNGTTAVASCPSGTSCVNGACF